MTRALAVLAAFAVCACSVVVGTNGLSGGSNGAASADASVDAAPAVADGSAPGAPIGTSCRSIHEKVGDAGSGSYAIAVDGGVTNVDCDMESFDGGWTRVTPAMILEDKAVQDYAPGTPAHVDVVRTTDLHGGIAYDARVTAVNCGKDGMQKGPGHYFIVADLDGWTQLMATYAFSDSSSCWSIFASSNAKDTNMQQLDLSKDLIGPQLNMGRDPGGKAIPFDGRTSACDENPDNFWGSPYSQEAKSARVVLRRFSPAKPAGIAIETDCGLAGWKITDIHVR